MGPRRYTVVQSTGCWEWNGAKNPRGYGKLTVKNKTVSAHRYAWITSNGQIPDGKHVLHRCDNRSCVNPGHLFLGTHRDNMRDMAAKDRDRPPFGKKLSKADVFAIRLQLASGISQHDIASAFGVTQSNISCINRNISWAHRMEN